MDIRNKDLGLLILRLMLGGFMVYGHGWGKMLRLFSGEPIQFFDPFGTGPELAMALAVFAEVLCALFIVMGLFTRYATVPLIITMIVAAFMANAGEPFGKQEKALMYLIGYISLLLTGPGWYSLDAQWRKQA